MRMIIRILSHQTCENCGHKDDILEQRDCAMTVKRDYRGNWVASKPTRWEPIPEPETDDEPQWRYPSDDLAKEDEPAAVEAAPVSGDGPLCSTCAHHECICDEFPCNDCCFDADGMAKASRDRPHWEAKGMDNAH